MNFLEEKVTHGAKKSLFSDDSFLVRRSTLKPLNEVYIYFIKICPYILDNFFMSPLSVHIIKSPTNLIN